MLMRLARVMSLLNINLKTTEMNNKVALGFVIFQFNNFAEPGLTFQHLAQFILTYRATSGNALLPMLWVNTLGNQQQRDRFFRGFDDYLVAIKLFRNSQQAMWELTLAQPEWRSSMLNSIDRVAEIVKVFPQRRSEVWQLTLGDEESRGRLITNFKKLEQARQLFQKNKDELAQLCSSHKRWFGQYLNRMTKGKELTRNGVIEDLQQVVIGCRIYPKEQAKVWIQVFGNAALKPLIYGSEFEQDCLLANVEWFEQVFFAFSNHQADLVGLVFQLPVSHLRLFRTAQDVERIAEFLQDHKELFWTLTFAKKTCCARFIKHSSYLDVIASTFDTHN